MEGYSEMNIRVGTQAQLEANIPFQALVKDPVTVKQMQEMALASINGIEYVTINLRRRIHKTCLQLYQERRIAH
jgi:hypothetical protein